MDIITSIFAIIAGVLLLSECVVPDILSGAFGGVGLLLILAGAYSLVYAI